MNNTNKTTTKRYSMRYSFALGCLSACDYGYHNQKPGSYLSDNADLVNMVDDVLPNELTPDYLDDDCLFSMMTKAKEMITYLADQDFSYINTDQDDTYIFVGIYDNESKKYRYTKALNIPSNTIYTNYITKVEGLDY